MFAETTRVAVVPEATLESELQPVAAERLECRVTERTRTWAQVDLDRMPGSALGLPFPVLEMGAIRPVFCDYCGGGSVMVNAQPSVLCRADAISLAPAVKSTWAASRQEPGCVSLPPCPQRRKLFLKDGDSDLGAPRKGILAFITACSPPSRERWFSYLPAVALDLCTGSLVLCPSRGGVWTEFRDSLLFVCFLMFIFLEREEGRRKGGVTWT